jgi:hypothetical protein
MNSIFVKFHSAWQLINQNLTTGSDSLIWAFFVKTSENANSNMAEGEGFDHL